jgi:flavin reductase
MLATSLRQTSTSQTPLPPAGGFRYAMSLAVTGVNIVTTDGPLGRIGLTVSAVSSVSAEPPMLLVCVNQKSIACNAIRGNGYFAVNVLAASQQSVAETFSGSDKHGSAFTFTDEQWLAKTTGSPVLRDAVAAFECEIESAVAAATHTIFIGRVIATTECAAMPLLYTNRGYGRPFCSVGQRLGAQPITGATAASEQSLARS